jgi:hypothetical protein
MSVKESGRHLVVNRNVFFFLFREAGPVGLITHAVIQGAKSVLRRTFGLWASKKFEGLFTREIQNLGLNSYMFHNLTS